MKHVRLKTVSLKNHHEYNERWVHDVIANDPSILGIGRLVVRERERIHAGAGRLDMLLQDEDGIRRYEVEVQLGSTDETHIIRTIEYWDIEKKRYPTYEHTAVIVAEDITSRFLNVISLFNGCIPIMALQLSAIETSEGIGLHFTKVLDTVRLGGVDDEPIEPVDRKYWETKRGTSQTVAIADSVLGIVRGFLGGAQASYNKEYIGLWVDGKACNFAVCVPQKNAMQLKISLPQSDEIDERVDASGVNALPYDLNWSMYRLKLNQEDVEKHKSFLAKLLKDAYDYRVS